MSIPVTDPKNEKSVRVVTWNIDGIGDKRGDIDIQNVIQSNNIIVFTETMKGRDYKANIPGYCSWHFARNTRNNKTKRNAVGFPVLVRETLRKYFTVHQASENIVCMDIKSRHNGIFHVGFVYITPMGSTFYRENRICPFDEIQDEITKKTGHAKRYNIRGLECTDLELKRN